MCGEKRAYLEKPHQGNFYHLPGIFKNFQKHFFSESIWGENFPTNKKLIGGWEFSASPGLLGGGAAALPYTRHVQDSGDKSCWECLGKKEIDCYNLGAPQKNEKPPTDSNVLIH